LGFILELAQKNLRPNSGNLYLLSIDNVLFVILIFGNLDEEVLPFKRHRPLGTESGKTSHIERLNNTLRQQISPLVPKTLSFSKKLLAPYWGNFYIVHYYNSCIRKRYHYCA
jgi:hypothetical protein